MGVDIHAVLEVKDEQGKWSVIPEIPECFQWRSYLIFDALEDMSHSGLPEEVKGQKYRYEINR